MRLVRAQLQESVDRITSFGERSRVERPLDAETTTAYTNVTTTVLPAMFLQSVITVNDNSTLQSTNAHLQMECSLLNGHDNDVTRSALRKDPNVTWQQSRTI